MNSKLAAFLKKYLTIIAVLLVCLYFGSKMRAHTDAKGDFNFRDYGQLLAIDGGRFKPLETVARTKLMILTHRQGYSDLDDQRKFLVFFETPKSYPATKWLLDVQVTQINAGAGMANLFQGGKKQFPAIRHKVFRIENDQLLRFLNLKLRPGSWRYSLVEIMFGNDGEHNNIQAFAAESDRVRHKDPKQWTLFDAKVQELSDHINIFMQLSTHSAPLCIPNADGSDQWLSFRDAHAKYSDLANLPNDIEAQTYKVYHDLLQAYAHDDPIEFNRILQAHLPKLRSDEPAAMSRVGVEVFFNEFAPFYHCLAVYVMIAIICALAWLAPVEWTQRIQRACYAAMAVSFVVHLSGLIIRMYLTERMFVFVTNLYSSAVFIGLGSVLFCLIAEYFYRNGIAIVVGSVAGFCTLIIAHMLSLSGDTLEMMQAVLDTNFWLATHVTIITLGYVSAFVAGLMGIAYIFLGFFTNMLRKDGSAELGRMTYGVLCAGMFLSFVGTVLGGLWADYSWGRFWGWDPKENGALLIVIWIALILHARWGGMVKQRGIAVLSVVGIIVTSWSWFGTNFLGVGLHSYGFRQGAMTSLVLIDMVFLAVAGLGMLPLTMWQSFRPLPVEPSPQSAKAGARPVAATM